MSEHSGNLLLNGEMTAEKAMTFLDQAQTYFERRPTGGEDSAYWANVYNAEWCKKITDFVAHEDIRLKTSQARLSEAVKVLEELGTAVSIYRLGVKDTVPKIAAGDHGDMATIKALMANNDILDASMSKARQFLATLGEENDQEA